MTIYEIATLVSLGLTPGVIISSALVASLFWHPYVRALSDKNRTAVGWMIIGVEANFVGDVVDNIWWGIAWSGDFVDPTSTVREFFFTNGIYSNVIFRQTFGLIGAMCHIKSGITTTSVKDKKVYFWAAAFGIAWVLFLIFLKNNVVI